jgi:general nucleoside transport system permease protein
MLIEIDEFLRQVVIYSSIYTLTALGIVIAGRTGVFIIYGEGVMLTAASTGFLAAFITESWVMGFVVGGLVGMLFGLFFILLHEGAKLNQFIIGIGLIILGAGLSDLIYKLVVGVVLIAPRVPRVAVVEIPFITDLPILSAFLRQTPIVYLMYVATFAAYWFYYRTKYGLESRAIGENPKAADVMGISVTMRRLFATVAGCALIGVAGAYMPIVITGSYTPQMTADRGFMAIGIAIFASWKPQLAIVGGFLFAAVEVIAVSLQLADTWVPYQFFLMLPFVTVLVVMMILKKRIEWPASIGKLYERE